MSLHNCFPHAKFSSLGRDVSSGILIPRMLYRHPKKIKSKQKKKKEKKRNKSLLDFKMTSKRLKCLFQQCRSIKFNYFWPLSSHNDGGMGRGVASRDNKTSDTSLLNYFYI